MRVLFATAELSPLVSVGGLAEASAGLVIELRAQGVDVEVVVPDYVGSELHDQERIMLDVPHWAAPASARRGRFDGFGEVTLVDVPGIRRANPYVDESGAGWPDNADRFFAFSAAVAALARSSRPDVLHCNDWHTGAAIGLIDDAIPTVFTIHTIGHQGWTSGGWLGRIHRRPDLYESYGGTNPLAGAVQLADRVLTVSPSYADEIRTPEGGGGLHVQLDALGDRLIGIRNGIDVARWNPEADRFIAAGFSDRDPAGKAHCRAALTEELAWADTKVPIVAMVTRLVDQKGVDLALEATRFADGVPFRLAMLGSGERWIADWARHLAREHPASVWFLDGYDTALAHRLFAGADLLLMPSRFEPCGLAQMQAMAYGTIPVVTAVGGLRDTVADADADRKGTGFVAPVADIASIVDALHRAVRAWKQPRRRSGIALRGMGHDWSWQVPARRHVEVYEDLVAARSNQP
jgi:starch synthase